MRISLLRGSLSLAFAVAMGACYTGPGEQPDLLTAEGTLFDVDGQPLVNAPVDSYEILFRISPTLEISRTLTDDEDALRSGIVSGSDGKFQIASRNLQLGYSYDTQREVCYNTCVSYADYCTDTWVGGSCRWVDGGCWVDEDGNEYCDSGYEDCDGGYWDTSCSSYCTSYVLDCYWLTDTHWVGLSTSDVRSARTQIRMTDSEGTPYLIPGLPLESRKRPDECTPDLDGHSNCTPFNEWIQRDEFHTPFVTGASEGLQKSSRVRVSRPLQPVTHIGANQHELLTEQQMSVLRELRALLGVQETQVQGRR